MNIQLGNENVLLYMQIYNYYKDLITTGKLVSGSKLPSIRQSSAQLSVSRTTVENAYMQLAADGYIIAKPQSGYYVSGLNFALHKPNVGSVSGKSRKNDIIYDFASAKVDRNSFDFNLWRRYIKSALRQDERLLSYGEPQGEYELRSALAKYIGEKRNVVCGSDSIIVGAGVQSLLHIICALWNGEKSISFGDADFGQGIAVFADHGWDVRFGNCDASVIYTTPSHMNNLGSVMTVRERLALIRSADKNSSLIIEDDYDSEFSYFNRPAPSLQSLTGGHNIIYMGTFSRLLVPSIRISYMVLPPDLLSEYYLIADRYNQTASKTEQIALSRFISDGHLASQTRKLRKLYSAKAKFLADTVKTVFADSVDVSQTENGLKLCVVFKNAISAEKLMSAAEKRGIAILAYTDKVGNTNMVLSCTSVETEQTDKAVRILYEIVGTV